MNGLKNIKITLVEAGAGSAGTELTSDSVDMEGFDGVMFVGSIATVNAGNYGKVATSSDDSNFNDLTGTKVVPGTNGDSFLIDVYKPLERYLRCHVIRAGANTVTGDVYAIQYGPVKPPVTQGATIDSELHISPAEGTA